MNSQTLDFDRTRTSATVRTICHEVAPFHLGPWAWEKDSFACDQQWLSQICFRITLTTVIPKAITAERPVWACSGEDLPGRVKTVMGMGARG